MASGPADLLHPRASDYLIAAAGAWVFWLIATSLATAVVTLGAAPEGFDVDQAAIEATLMLFSGKGLLLVICLEFLIAPLIVRLLLHYGLARIAIYMMVFAVIWLGILVCPLGPMFGMTGILRQMGWLTLFLVWGGWNWWTLAHRPLRRVLQEAAFAWKAQPVAIGAQEKGREQSGDDLCGRQKSACGVSTRRVAQERQHPGL